MEKPILVTGSHRSGSTWVGKMIANSKDVCYIHEPFNIKRYFSPITKYFYYVNDKNDKIYKEYIKNLLGYKPFKVNDLLNEHSLAAIKFFMLENIKYFIGSSNQLRPLIKDPIAIFSAPWLYKKFNMQVIVVVRHPAAFANSLKKVSWSHPFEHFLSQPALVNGILAPFKPAIEKFAFSEKDMIDQAILLWNLIHYAIIKYKHKYNDWYFIKHEKISLAPLDEFKKIFEYLELKMDKKTCSKIIKYSSAGNVIASKSRHQIKRNSKSIIKNWKTKLTREEIERIKEGTKDIAMHFYSDNDW